MAFKTIEVRLVAVATGFRTEMAAASAEVKGLGAELYALGESGNRGVRQLGMEMSALAAVVGGIEALSVKAFAGFDERMRNVASITQDGAKNFKAYEDAALSISSTLPVSANQVAEALYHVASAGFTGKAGIEVVTAASRAAAAGLTDASTAANAITGVLNAYGLSAINAGHVSDVLFNTVRVGQTTFGDLAQQMGQFVGVAGRLNIPLEQIGAAFSTITVAGVPASEAGTALNRTLVSLISPTKSLSDLYHQWGFETGQQALAAKGLDGVLQGITQAAGGNAETLKQLAGDQRAFRGELALSAQDGALFQRQLSSFGDVAGQTGKALEQQSQSLSAQMKVMGNDVTNAGIALAQGLVGPLKDVVGFVGDAAQGFEHLPGPLRDVVAIAGLAFVGLTALGGLAFVQARVVGALALAWQSMHKPVADATAALGGVVPAAEAGKVAIDAEAASLARYAEAAGIAKAASAGAVTPSLAGAAVPGEVGGALGSTPAAVSALASSEVGATEAATGLGLSLTGVGTAAGIAMLVVGGFTTYLALSGHAAHQAKDDLDALKDATNAYAAGQAKTAVGLVVQSGVLSGVSSQLHAYKVNLADAALAVLGNADAQARLVGEIAAGTSHLQLTAQEHTLIAAAIRGHKSAVDELANVLPRADVPGRSQAVRDEAQSTLTLVSRIQQLVAAHKIDADTANELAGALGNVANAADVSAQADAQAAEQSLRDAETKKAATEAVSGLYNAMQEAGSPTKMFADFQASLNQQTQSATQAQTAQNKITKDAQTIQNDAAQAAIDHARAELQLERANQGVVTSTRAVGDAQKNLNDLVSFGLEEERARLALDAQSAVISHTEALLSQADAQKKLNDIESGRVGMADSARPRAILDAQLALEKANIAVQRSALDATDAQRKLADSPTTQAEERADAEQKVADALLAQREASQQVAADQLAIVQQQTKLAQGSQNAADQMGIAADRMAGAVAGGVGKIKGSFDQWVAYQEDQAKKMQAWFGDIVYLAEHGHRDVANQMLALGIDTADYAAAAVQKIKSGQGLGGLDAAMTTIAQLSTADFSILWNTAMTDLQQISQSQGADIAALFNIGLGSGVADLQKVVDAYTQVTQQGANAIIVSFGGKPIVVGKGTTTLSQNPGIDAVTKRAIEQHNRAAGGIEPHVTDQPTVLYGERETGGEAFIPRRGDRNRQVALTREVAGWFGYELVPMGDGPGLRAMAAGGTLPAAPVLPTPTGREYFVTGANTEMKYVHDTVQSLISRAGAGSGGVGSPVGPAPSGNVRDWIAQAVAITGVPTSWIDPLYIIAMGESGGDPHSINTWDSNARAGTPSEGLMQTIGPTFLAHAMPGHGDIWNPVDDTIAAIGYIEGRYGDPWHTPGVISQSRGGPYRGYAAGGLRDRFGVDVPIGMYDAGGFLPPGASIAVNNTGHPEPVGAGAVTVTISSPLVSIEQHVAGGTDPEVFRKVTKQAIEPAISAALRRLLQEIRVR